jgi:gliding motility-associated-like protein
VGNLLPSGAGIKWYANASNGTALDGTTALTSGSTYYASQTENGCESTSRATVTVTIYNTPGAPTADSPQTFCSSDSPTVDDLLTTTGTNIKWYADASTGTALSTTEALASGTYYASQTENGCESTSRATVTVTIHTAPGAPTASSPQTFCSSTSPTVADLTTSSGTNIKWYADASTGTALDGTTALTNGGTYYASQTENGCESPRTAVTVAVNTTPTAPTANSAQTFCSSDSPTVGNLSPSGTGIKWYSDASTGTALDGTTALTNGTYYASQTTNGCESPRTAVTVTVNTTPSMPTASSPQTFCSATNPTVADLSTITGTGIKWYDNASSGTALDGSYTLTDGNSYYASQTENGCESTRTAVTVAVNTTPGAPTANSPQTFCSAINPTVADLLPSGTGIKWYADASNGASLTTTTALTNGGTYYASQTENGCESPRTAVTVIIYTTPSAPTANSPQTFCSATSLTVASLSATGTDIKWYSDASTGTALDGTTALTNGGTYYASQTENDCESTLRAAVTVTIYNTPAAPTADSPQTFCSSSSPTVADLTTSSGTNIKWYAVASNGTPLVGTTALTSGSTYYASQTTDGCESPRTAVTVIIYTTPSAPTASSPQTFCTATSPTVGNLSATGTGIKWYADASTDTPLAGTYTLTSGTYYASQTTDGCESPRTAVTVTIYNTPAAPTADSPQTFCSADSPTVADLSTTTGTNIKWYADASTGSPLAGTTALTNGDTYYVSQTENSCESPRTAVTVTIYTTPDAPTANSAQTFCSADSPTVADLSATGTGIKWYANASNGTALDGTTALTSGSTYYASQTENGCESPRTAVEVTVHTTPTAPSADSPQTFCSATNPTVADLLPSGTGIKWYSDASTGTALTTTTALTNGGTYYASQTENGCESPRTAVEVTVHTTPAAPTANSAQTFCSSATPTVGNLSATGTGIKWYADASTGTPLNTTEALASGTYYASQATNGCESPRTAVTVTIYTTPAAPSASSPQIFCSADSPTVADLSATGTNIKWYSDASTGTALDGTYTLTSGSYYASQTTNGCESTSRATVTVTVNPTPTAPMASSPQTFCSASNPTVADLLPSGTNIKWYADASTGTALTTTTALTTGTYYASQTENGCESTSRATVTVTVNTTPTAPTASSPQTFCSSDSPTVGNLSATGTGIKWYDNASTGSPLDGSYTLTDGGSYYASQTENGCESPRTAVTVTIHTTPSAPSADSPQTFCSATSPTVADLLPSGANIKWYNDASTGTALSTTEALAPGSYYASQTTDGCESPRTAVTVTVYTTPAAPTANSPQTFCSASSPTVADLLPSGTSIKWYADASTGTALSTTETLASGTYYASQTTDGCESTSRTAVTVTVYTTPAVPAASVTDVCFGNTLIFTAPAGYSSYEWREDTRTGSVVGTTQTVQQTAIGSYTYVVRVQDQHGCWSEFSAAATGEVYALPTMPEIIYTDVCFGDSLIFISQEGFASYEWIEVNTMDTVWTVVGYIGRTETGSYTYRLRVTDGHGCLSDGYSPPATGEVFPLPGITLSGASPDAATCPEMPIAEPIAYTLSGSAASYTITGLPEGITATLAGNEITIAGAPAAGGQGFYDYTIVTLNPHGCANSSVTGRITVYAPALPPELTALNTPTVCRGNSVTLIASSAAASAYYWTRNGQTLPDATAAQYTTGDDGLYAVSIETIDGCRSAANTITVTVIDRPATPILTAGGEPTTVCDGESVILSVETPQTGVTYQWYRDGQLLNAATGTLYEARVTGTYTAVPLNAYGCDGEPSNPIHVAINRRPEMPEVLIIGPSTFCEGETTDLLAVSSGAVFFRWFKDNVEIPGATTALLHVSESGHYCVEALSGEGCTSARSKELEIVRYDLPTNVRITGAPPAFCRGDSILLQASSDGGETWRWFYNGAPIAGNAATCTASQAGIYQVEAVSPYGCVSARSEGLTVTLYDVPATPAITLSGSPYLCTGESLTLTVSATGASSFSWMRNGSLIAAGLARTLTVTESGVYTVQAINATGCLSALSAPQTIIVEDYPPAPIIDSEEFLRRMRGSSLVLSVINIDNTLLYQWYKDQREIADARGTALSIAPLRLSDAGVYSVRATTALAGCASESQWITLEVFNDIIVGNIVTPNDDENNEYFRIEGLETYAAHEIKIVNRNGNEIFRSYDYRSDIRHGWRGDNFPEGVYFYRIRLTDTDGTITVKSGYVVLKRD